MLLRYSNSLHETSPSLPMLSPAAHAPHHHMIILHRHIHTGTLALVSSAHPKIWPKEGLGERN
jgi:NAD-dependent oxidoreductase involved in siderophore biosynthesis